MCKFYCCKFSDQLGHDLRMTLEELLALCKQPLYIRMDHKHSRLCCMLLLKKVYNCIWQVAAIRMDTRYVDQACSELQLQVQPAFPGLIRVRPHPTGLIRPQACPLEEIQLVLCIEYK